MKNSILIFISVLFLTGCASLYDRKINKYREVIQESPFTERVWGTYKNGRDGQKKYEKIYKCMSSKHFGERSKFCVRLI